MVLLSYLYDELIVVIRTMKERREYKNENKRGRREERDLEEECVVC